MEKDQFPYAIMLEFLNKFKPNLKKQKNKQKIHKNISGSSEQGKT